MPNPTEGARLLRGLLYPAIRQVDLAKRLGVTRQLVHGWLRGADRPSPRLMRDLEDELGIPMRAWVEPASEPGDSADTPRPGDGMPSPEPTAAE